MTAKYLRVALLLSLYVPAAGFAQEIAGVTRTAPSNLLIGASAEPAAPCMGADVQTKVTPSAPEYTIGEGDVLKINVWKEPDLSLSMVTVRPDGMISMPLVGVVKVGGSGPSQVQDELTTKLSRFLSHPKVTVTVTEIRSKLVYVTGEVAKPGVFPLVAPTSVLQAIVMAGGPTPFAHRKSMFVLRSVDGKEQKIPVNYVKLLHGGDGSANVSLKPGDTVVVP